MHLRHPRQTPELTGTEGSFSYQGVSKGGGSLARKCIFHNLDKCIFLQESAFFSRKFKPIFVLKCAY